MARERAQMQAEISIEQCLAVQYDISRILADATSLDAALHAILEALGKGFHGRLMTLWLWDAPTRQLSCHTSWPAIGVEDQDAVALTARLPERVWQSGEPIWLVDLAHGWSLSDAHKASHHPLRWAGAFPIRGHGATMGVIVCFYHARVVLEAPVTRTFIAIGNMLGPFIMDMQATSPVRVSDAPRKRERQIHDTLDQLALGEANRRMDEFLSAASHELKTPLTSVKGYIQLATHRLRRTLTASVDDSDRAQFDQSLQGAIDLLQRSDYYSDVLNRVVTELLDVTRIQADTIAVHRASCDLVAIATEAVQMQRLALPGRDIRLDIAADFAAIIFADAARIGQVITNLLVNALNYSAAESGVTITMRPDDARITVAVHDEGPGIAEDEQQHIWERFYRGAAQREYAGSGGLGIGLYISRKIVERHAGQIGVRSAVGAGSTFWFSLPLDSAPALETC